MTHFDKSFSALSQIMAAPGGPRTIPTREPIASLIDKVNAAKRRYQPGAR